MQPNLNLMNLLHELQEDSAERMRKNEELMQCREELYRQRYPYSRRFMKRYMIDLFSNLKKERHYIYALLLKLPAEHFSIVQYDDWRLYWKERGTDSDTMGRLDEPKIFTLAEFMAERAEFHRLEEFTIYLFREWYNYSNRMLTEDFERLYMTYLYDVCFKGLLENRPVELTRELIREYGLTREDVKQVKECLREVNDELRKRLQAEFDDLKKLDCIVK